MRWIDFWFGVPLCFIVTTADRVLRAMGFKGRGHDAPPRHVLFIQLAEMGTMVVAYPALRKVRELYPEATVHFLCFGQVRHTRLRPVRNAFAYGSYYLRLPLRSMGAGGFGCALFSRNRFNLLSFADADHGDGRQPLTDWIDGMLRREGVLDADGEVWLQAMPRVLGFVFNPVSFWFCHRADGALRAVLCDVRNTFGERHFYLLDKGAAIGNGSEHFTELTLRTLEEKTPLLRCHRQYLVNPEQIKEISFLEAGAVEIITRNNHHVTVSRRLLGELMVKLGLL